MRAAIVVTMNRPGYLTPTLRFARIGTSVLIPERARTARHDLRAAAHLPCRRSVDGGGVMADTSQGTGWWQASNGKWYPPEQHPNYQPPPPPPSNNPAGGGAPFASPVPTAPPAHAYGQPVAAPAPGMYFDEASGLSLPQGVVLAGAGRRIGAFFLALPLSIVTLGIGYVIWGLIAWGRGQTPALQVLGMRCWRPETGRVAGWWWMALREIIGRIAESILSIITLLISLILMMSRKDRMSLHDLIAGTVVLYDPQKLLAPNRQVAPGSPSMITPGS
jgi:uncharacterized RDD family membrane protein YckC